MGSAVIDTSLLIANLDESDALHAAAVEALQKAGRTLDIVVPVLAFAELLVGAAGSGPGGERVAEDYVASLGRIEPLGPAVARAGARLRAKHGMTLADAMILATGIELAADEILTADRRWRRVDRRVRVVSPKARR